MSSHPETFELQYFVANNTVAGNILEDAASSQKREPGGTAGMSRLQGHPIRFRQRPWPAIMSTNLIWLILIPTPMMMWMKLVPLKLNPTCGLPIGWWSTSFRVRFPPSFHYKWFFGGNIYKLPAVLGSNLMFDRTGPDEPDLWSPVQGSASWLNWTNGLVLSLSEMPAELDQTGPRHH